VIRRSPAELYLKYLIVHPDKFTNEQIIDICRFAQMDWLGMWYLERLRKDLTIPVPFYPKDRSHYPSQRFLYKKGLERIFFGGPDMIAAFAMVTDARAKEFVESMIILHTPPSTIAFGLQRRGTPATADSVELYKRFFWNVDLLDVTELRAILKMRIDVMEKSDDKEVVAQAQHYKKAAYNDPRRVAAELPFSPLSAVFVQMRMGLMPSKMDLAKIVEATRLGATMRAFEATLLGGTDASHAALNFATVTRQMTDILDQVIRPDEKMREELATIAMRNDTNDPPFIQDLTKGSHTAEIIPTEKKSHELQPRRTDEGKGAPDNGGKQ
jgi:hypothetical protein